VLGKLRSDSTFKWNDNECAKKLKAWMSSAADEHSNPHPKGSSGKATGRALTPQDAAIKRLLGDLIEDKAVGSSSGTKAGGSGGKASSGSKRAEERSDAKRDKYMDGEMFKGKGGLDDDDGVDDGEPDSSGEGADSVRSVRYWKQRATEKGINTSTSHSWWDLYLDDMEAEFMDSMATVS